MPVETTPMDALQTMPVGSDCFPSSSDALFFFSSKDALFFRLCRIDILVSHYGSCVNPLQIS